MLLHARIHWPIVHIRTVLVKITLETDMGIKHSGHGIKEQLGTVGHVAPTSHANLEQVVGIPSKVVQKGMHQLLYTFASVQFKRDGRQLGLQAFEQRRLAASCIDKSALAEQVLNMQLFR